MNGRRFGLLLALAMVAVPDAATAYVGPGVGISFLGMAIGMLSFVGVAVGIVFAYPLRALRRRLKGESSETEHDDTDESRPEGTK